MSLTHSEEVLSVRIPRQLSEKLQEKAAAYNEEVAAQGIKISKSTMAKRILMRELLLKEV